MSGHTFSNQVLQEQVVVTGFLSGFRLHGKTRPRSVLSFSQFSGFVRGCEESEFSERKQKHGRSAKFKPFKTSANHMTIRLFCGRCETAIPSMAELSSALTKVWDKLLRCVP